MKKLILTIVMVMAATAANAFVNSSSIVAERSWRLSDGVHGATMFLMNAPASRSNCTGPASAKQVIIVSERVVAPLGHYELVATGCWFSVEGGQIAVFANTEDGGTWQTMFTQDQFEKGPAFTSWSVASWK